MISSRRFVSRRRFVVNALIIIIVTSMVIIARFLAPQSVYLQRSLTLSNLESSASSKGQPTPKPGKDDSMFTLLPEKLQNSTLLIIINTVPNAIDRRNTLRQTWAKQSSWTIVPNSPDSLPASGSVVNITYFFMMGYAGYAPVDEIVERESSLHKDILRVNVIDTYRSMVNKILLTFEWITTLDIKPHLIAKADHDVYVKTPELATWVQKTDNISLSKLYTGFVKEGAEVQRDILSPWYVSEEDFEQKIFPPYCLGPFYVFSRDLFLDLVTASKVIKPFPVEDSFMAVLAKSLSVDPLYTGSDLFNADRKLNSVVLQTSENKLQIPSGIVLGDSLSPASINLIHRIYMRTKLTKTSN